MKILVIYPSRGVDTGYIYSMDGIDVTMIYLNSCCVDMDGVLYSGKRVDFKSFDACFLARPDGNNAVMSCVYEICDQEGIPVFPERDGIKAATNKMVSHLKFKKAGLSQPATVLMRACKPDQNLAMKVLGNFPWFCKPVSGSLGEGAELVNDRIEFEDYMSSKDRKGVIVQKYIDPYRREDERHIVVGDRVVSSELRVAGYGKVVTNLARGGRAEIISCDKETEEMCVKAARAVGLTFAGVDIIRDKDGNPYILEINSFPLTRIIELTGHNHYEDLLKYLKKYEKNK